MPEESKQKVQDSILGLSTTELAGLSVEELTGNQTAIKMMMHYYKQLVEENSTLKNTYVSAYDKQRSNPATGVILLAVSNISIGFGVNLLTGNSSGPGWSSLIIGVGVAIAGIYFSFFKDKN